MLRRTFSVSALAAAVLPKPALAGSPTAPEDERLNAFFEAASLERLRLSPEAMTYRGMKDSYGELANT